MGPLLGFASRAEAQLFRRPVIVGEPGEIVLPTIGGGGGGQFIAHCPDERNLIGFELRAGDDVDAIAPVCAVSNGPTQLGFVSLTQGSGLVDSGPPAGLYQAKKLPPGWNGGVGGELVRLLCPKDTPIVIGIYVAAEGVDTVVVNNIHLYCGRAVASQSIGRYPSAVFDGPGYTPSPGWLGIGIGGAPAHHREDWQQCPPGKVAVGARGRSGIWVDAIGLICNAAIVYDNRIGPISAVKSIGRVPASRMPAGPGGRSICEAATAARARNSPAAPNLAAQCRAAKDAAAVKSIGRVKVPEGAPGPPMTICERAAAARARKSVAAPNLEAQCRASGEPQPPAEPDAPPQAAPAAPEDPEQAPPP